ncbi:transcription cofactor HES-6-like isoform X2 [Coregonus clupeaformis]|uniref:transcription cofactor HES-6-like isoform X2 n=1 Tax=Coregonus clupeaformis TaxID=59861 RepID=UPI001BE0A570|nr:transcription cofactor HES-6-like isoform X2 [Coregonus clupeaformis]
MTASTMAHNVGKHSSAKEERKLRKPLIERKRRERINNCLDQLKETVVGAFSLDQSKLEKADILEMTVKHLQNVQTHKFSDPTLGLEAQQKYSTGYIQCMHEVHNMLLNCEWMDKTLGSRLLNHLLKSLPRSSEERPSQANPNLRSNAHPPSQGPGSPTTPLREDPRSGRQGQREGPLCHVVGPQDKPLLLPGSPHLLSPHLGMLEMWRPW